MVFLKRSWPLLLIAAGLTLAYALGATRYLTWATLSHSQAALRAAIAVHPILSGAAFTLLYVAVAAFSVPEGALLTVVGGLLFGTVAGTIYTVIGATAGAVLLFLAARYTLRPVLEARARPFMDRIALILERDGFNALLALRLIVVVPFWLANLAPALVGMRLAPFALATFIGIIPGTAVFASIGAGLGDILAAGNVPDLRAVASPSILLPLTGLALLSLLPIAWRRLRRSNG
jgi:uncharacterized membrane protein YdjX (TVP38/TMEM64 family)